jgi:hypothetical protein
MTTAPVSTESAQELFAAIKEQVLPMQQLMKKGQEAYDDPANKELIEWARFECATVSPNGSPSIDMLNEVGLDRDHLPDYCIGIVIYYFREFGNTPQFADTEEHTLSLLKKPQTTYEEQKQLVSAFKEAFKVRHLQEYERGNSWATFLNIAALYLAFDLFDCSEVAAEADSAARSAKGTTKPKNGFGN